MSAIQLKPLNEQVIVITGASSGIGLTIAETAAKAGAKVVLAARSKQTLDDIVARLGDNCLAVECDVADQKQVEQLAQTALTKFGRIDTWVNNAGLAIYGRLDAVSDADNRRLFDINFWGLVYGSLVALPHLKRQGGALINLGSEASEASASPLGMYGASKHAVKGFTDALRIEIEQLDKSPVSVTLIQPTAVDTPFDEHSANYMPDAATLPSPMIDPQQVADAILAAAVKPTHHTKVGVMSKVNTFAANNMPGVAEHMAAKQEPKFHKDSPNTNPDGTLNTPGQSGRTHGQHAPKK